MRKALCAATAVAAATLCGAQVGGGSVYGQGGPNREQTEMAKRVISKEEMPPNATSTFVDASVMVNVKADDFVALFGISGEGKSPAECEHAVADTIAKFTANLSRVGVSERDWDVDYVAENRTYGYEVKGDIAKETLTGFELKKNVAVHFGTRSKLDAIVGAASEAGIFDLIKVDYIVHNIEAVHSRLMAEAAAVVKEKAQIRLAKLGIPFRWPPQIYAERYASYYPSDMYSSYQAYESEDVSGGYYRQRFTVQNARKSRTFYFEGLSPRTFDRVVNPVVIEPVVQFTLYLKVRLDSGGASVAKTRKARKR